MGENSNQPSQFSDAEDDFDWDEMPDTEPVQIAADFLVDDLDAFAEAVDDIADRTGMDELSFRLVARLVARGPKAAAVSFIEECEEGLHVLPQGDLDGRLD